MMETLFRRHLALYAEYHRNRLNCALHCIGIPTLFLAVLIPLALFRVPIPLGLMEASIGPLLLVPAAILWIALDPILGAAMLFPIASLAAGAEWITRSGSDKRAWSIAALMFIVGWAFQIVGHAVFERRKPALLDNAFHMFIGPMFIMAKILVALRLRRDLDALLHGTGSADIAARPLLKPKDSEA